MEDSGTRLRLARARAGYKTATAAIKRFGWRPPTTYRSHENGQTPVPPEDAIAYAAAYKVTPEWIVFGVGDPGDLGIDRMLRDKPEDVKRRILRTVEALLNE